MLRPHGANFCRRSEFAALDLGLSLGQICIFLGRQLNRRLVNTREFQHDAGKFVLARIW